MTGPTRADPSVRSPSPHRTRPGPEPGSANGDPPAGRDVPLPLLALPVLVAAVVVVVVAASIGFGRTGPGGDDGDRSASDGTATAGAAAVEPIDVASAGPSALTAEELLAAADLVVVATVGAVEPGRAVTDPGDPATGIRTSLFELRVEQVVAGSAPDPLIIEHETALLDGTPITVDGVAPPAPGERGLFVLIGGTGGSFPHHAIVASQGWLVLDGEVARAPAGSVVDQPLDGLELSRIAELTGR